MSTPQLVIETRDGWMIRCKCSCGWHEFPKERLSNGHAWTFNGDLFVPTFSPSMNLSWNPPGNPHFNPDVESGRCHFTVVNGIIMYCGDCSHTFRGPHPMLPWDPEKVAYYATLKEHGWP
jgi:hypothetical protein